MSSKIIPRIGDWAEVWITDPAEEYQSFAWAGGLTVDDSEHDRYKEYVKREKCKINKIIECSNSSKPLEGFDKVFEVYLDISNLLYGVKKNVKEYCIMVDSLATGIKFFYQDKYCKICRDIKYE